jgi:YebC/PmpR family DNA-binding regulatory protein
LTYRKAGEKFHSGLWSSFTTKKGSKVGKGWKNPIKAENAQKKGAIFTKVAREIQVAAKLGGPDPAGNSRLRMAIDAAREVACPNDTIERAIKKGAGLLDADSIEEFTLEGYGPHGVGVIVECQTNNRNRTVSEIRNIFKSHDGNMGESGSVSWMFQRLGEIKAIKQGEFDPVEVALEAGADDVEKANDFYVFWSHQEAMDGVRRALIERGWKIESFSLGYRAKNKAQINESQLKEVSEMLVELDEHEDIASVYPAL